MKQSSSLITFFVAALVVVMLGGLAGWYVFVHRQIAATQSADTARGFATGGAFGSANGASLDDAGNAIASGGASGTTLTSAGAPAPRLWHVSKNPVAGFGFEATTTSLYFAETANGNIGEANPGDTSIVRRSNTLQPKVYEALFAPDGAAILRSADGDTIKTFAGMLATTTQSIDSTSTPETLRGLYLAEGMLSLAVAPGHKIVYVVANSAGGSMVMQSDWRGAGQKKLFASPLVGWEVSVLLDGTVMLLQKPADNTPGFAFTLSQSGTLVPIETNVPGLTVLPRSSSVHLYGMSSNGLALYAEATSDAGPVRLPVATSADKCVWVPGKELIAYCAVPEGSGSASLSGGYRGTQHSADVWYKVNVSAGTADLIYSPDSSLALDVEKPAIDASGSYIAFTNGLDHSLWMFRVEK